MQKAEREAAIAANKKPIPPEQMLIICTELRALTNLIRENRGINSPAKAADVFDGWIDITEKRAWQDITMRKWRNEKY
ncbi:hypothetical protein FNH71_18645 [Salmonella enterica subsp. diarizonae]|nr:hypothetical protein [Salmonella enterica subsp. diarizonae]